MSNWNIGNILSYKKAIEGAVNYNWIIKTTKGKYLLRKLHMGVKEKNINFEMKYLNYLKKKGFPYKIPVPLLTKENKEFIKIKKDFFWLYKFIEGKHNKNPERNELSEIALMVARFHNIIEKSSLYNGEANQKDFGRNGIINEMKWFISKISKKKNKRDRIFIKESRLLIKIFKDLNTKDYNSLKKYPIHRDLNPQNILWKNKKIIGVLDFENVGCINDAFIRDIAIIMQYFCSNKEKSFNSKKARFFIKKYQEYRKLSKKEIKILINTIIATNIEDFGYAYWLLVNTPKRAKISHLSKYSKMVQYLFKNRDKFTKELLI